ncbi:hypothetical protein B0A51_18413, partial [Rachicladosporium sp. CCFEE 5018]
SLEQLSLNALVPFRNAIKEGLDAMMVGGCAMSSVGLNVMHACLSEQVVNDLLRNDLQFEGVVISDCLEMEALSHNIGVGGGTVMAVNAGCDIVLLCRSYVHQQEALEGFKLGIDNFNISLDRVKVSLKRILTLKAKCTTWEKALNPPGIELLSRLQPSHTPLSTRAYNASITVVKDKNRLLPLSNILEPDDELLLLTPLVKPLAASAAARALSDQVTSDSTEPHIWERSSSVMSGERVFRELGRSLARQRNGRVLHTSYTANGVRPQHENLINRAGAVIVVTADANRNLYQHGFTRHVSMICNMQYTSGGEKREKPLIVVAVSSPYDFAMEQSIGTYVLSLVKVLYGEFSAAGSLPGTISQSQKLSQSRQHWLVENFNEERDAAGLDVLIKSSAEGITPGMHSELSGAISSSFTLRDPDILEQHFVVRNSSTHALYGFCATYFFKATGTGVIAAIFVDAGRRKLSIGHSLHNRAIRTLLQREGIRRFQLGSRLPSIYLGIPTSHGGERRRQRSWFANLGWNTALSRSVCSMIARNLATWSPPPGMAKSLQSAGADFDLVYGAGYADAVLDHIKTNNRQGLAEVYKMALNHPSACGIIRAKRPEDGALVGTVVLYNMQSQLAEFVPAMKDVGELTGGISSPVISPSVGEYSTLLQGLILLGMRQIKQQGCGACILDYMDGDGNFDGLSAMGFSVLHNFEENTALRKSLGHLRTTKRARACAQLATMDHIGFDPASMNYVATAMQQPGRMMGRDAYNDMLLQPPMSIGGHSAYGYAGSEDMNMHGLPQQSTPSLKRAYSVFEDPYSDVVSTFEPALAGDPDLAESPSIDRDNKLLSFSAPRFDFTLLTYNFQQTSIRIATQLHGMFFLAESPWATAADTVPPPNELTCYRRNLFQITGEMTLPRSLRFVTNDQGEHFQIVGQELAVSATESTEGNAVKLISVPWKTPANPSMTNESEKSEREPPVIPLDHMSMQDQESEFVTFPVQWKRLQFRIATANNGRRKELQQHFTVRLKVIATLATGMKVPVCEVQSGAIIVRGRSPRNFQSRKDQPLNGVGHTRKISHQPASLRRNDSGDSASKKQMMEPASSIPVKPDVPLPPMSSASFYDPAEDHVNIGIYDWQASLPAQPGTMTAIPEQSIPYQAEIPAYAVTSPDLTRLVKPSMPPPAPINLSLDDSESPSTVPGITPPGAQRLGKPPPLLVRPPSFSINTLNSPDESADLLYEYFPLGLDDWMPPVDAVYRPHVVHHVKLPNDPRDPKAANAKGAKSRLLYSADVT